MRVYVILTIYYFTVTITTIIITIFLLRIALDGAASNLAESPVRALRQAVVVFIS